MDKSIKFINSFGSEIPIEELILQYESMCGITKNSIAPPQNLIEFEDRLLNFLNYLYERIFGLVSYLDIDERRTIDKNVSLENLIEIGLKCERKYSKKSLIINLQLNTYEFLKMALEKRYPFSEYAQALLGINIDLAGISQPQKLTIGFQAAAQVLWFNEKDKIHSIKCMREEIWKNKLIKNLLNLRRIHNERVVENAIRLVNPKLKGEKNKNDPYSELILIPNVFLKNPCRVNFLKLRFVIMVISKILFINGLSQEDIMKNKIIESYRERLRFYPALFINDWISEALLKSGNIFTL